MRSAPKAWCAWWHWMVDPNDCSDRLRSLADVVVPGLEKMEASAGFERQQSLNGLVSIIVASYNHEKYVVETLASIACQDYQHKHLILIDDGSTDATFEFALEFLRQAELKYVAIKKRNQGCPQISANQALMLTSSEWVCMIASDDVYAPDKLSRQVTVGEDSSADIVLGYAGQMEEGGGKKGHEDEWQAWYSGIRGTTAHPAAVRRLVFNQHYSIPYLGWMIRRRAFASLGLLDPSIYTEDFDFNLRMAKSGLTIAVSEGIMGWHRSTREKPDSDRVDRATRSFKQALRKNGATREEYLDACATVHINAAAVKFALGYRLAWLPDVMLAFMHAPLVASRYLAARLAGKFGTRFKRSSAK